MHLSRVVLMWRDITCTKGDGRCTPWPIMLVMLCYEKFINFKHLQPSQASLASVGEIVRMDAPLLWECCIPQCFVSVCPPLISEDVHQNVFSEIWQLKLEHGEAH